MYLKSKEITGIRISSSGIEASKNLSGPISWYTSRIAKHHNSAKHLSSSWTQTNKEIISEADLVIFMAPIHHDRVVKEFDFKGKHETWDIPDLVDLGIIPTLNTFEEDVRRMQFSEQTFEKIRKKVDTLIQSLLTPASEDSERAVFVGLP